MATTSLGGGEYRRERENNMERPANAYCPRCSTRLGVEHDPDYGWCLIHGTRQVGLIPLGIPERNADRLTNTCLDCEKPIYDNAKRCKQCAGKAMRGDARRCADTASRRGDPASRSHGSSGRLGRLTSREHS